MFTILQLEAVCISSLQLIPFSQGTVLTCTEDLAALLLKFIHLNNKENPTAINWPSLHITYPYHKTMKCNVQTRIVWKWFYKMMGGAVTHRLVGEQWETQREEKNKRVVWCGKVREQSFTPRTEALFPYFARHFSRHTPPNFARWTRNLLTVQVGALAGVTV